MNKEQAHKGLAERRADLVDELTRLKMRQAALAELLAMVKKKEADAARLAERAEGIK